MQGICAQLTGEGLGLAVDVAVYKESMLDWLGGLSAFYIYALY